MANKRRWEHVALSNKLQASNGRHDARQIAFSGATRSLPPVRRTCCRPAHSGRSPLAARRCAFCTLSAHPFSSSSPHLQPLRHFLPPRIIPKHLPQQLPQPVPPLPNRHHALPERLLDPPPPIANNQPPHRPPIVNATTSERTMTAE